VASIAFAEKLTLADPVVAVKSRSYPAVPAVILSELNADRDRDVLARMEHLAAKKRMRQPDITEAEMADYLALAENCQNLEQWLNFRRTAAQPATRRGVVAWALGTMAIVALLTAGLIAAIAVSVSGL